MIPRGTEEKAISSGSSNTKQYERQRLLDAVLSLKAVPDLSSIDLDQVARHAGLPEFAALCFDSREAFLVALHREFLDRLLSTVGGSMDALPPGVERLQRGVDAFLDCCLQHSSLRQQLLALEKAMPDLGRVSSSRRSGFRIMLTMEVSGCGIFNGVEFAALLRSRIEEASLVEITHGGPRHDLREQIFAFVKGAAARRLS